MPITRLEFQFKEKDKYRKVCGLRFMKNKSDIYFYDKSLPAELHISFHRDGSIWLTNDKLRTNVKLFSKGSVPKKFKGVRPFLIYFPAAIKKYPLASTKLKTGKGNILYEDSNKILCFNQSDGPIKNKVVLKFRHHDLFPDIANFIRPKGFEGVRMVALCRPHSNFNLIEAICSKNLRIEPGRVILNKLYYKRKKVYCLIY